jgi:hypothetical protein
MIEFSESRALLEQARKAYSKIVPAVSEARREYGEVVPGVVLWLDLNTPPVAVPVDEFFEDESGKEALELILPVLAQETGAQMAMLITEAWSVRPEDMDKVGDGNLSDSPYAIDVVSFMYEDKMQSHSRVYEVLEDGSLAEEPMVDSVKLAESGSSVRLESRFRFFPSKRESSLLA